MLHRLPLMTKVLTKYTEIHKIIKKGVMSMESRINVRLKVDNIYTTTEVNVNTYDKQIGENLLEYINKFQVSKTDKLAIKTAKGIFFINKSDIIFAEVFEKEVTISTIEKEITTRMTLHKLHQALTPTFIQISKSAIINVDFIKKVSPSFSGNLMATLINDKKVSISRRYVKNLKKVLDI